MKIPFFKLSGHDWTAWFL